MSNPAIRAAWRTSEGRQIWVQGDLSDERIQQNIPTPGITTEILDKIHLQQSKDDIHRTKLGPLSDRYQDCPHASIARFACIEFVLEATRQHVQEKFGNTEFLQGVVAGLKGVVFPDWSYLSQGCVLEYSLSEDRLSSGTPLIQCDFSFSADSKPGRLTLAWFPEIQMSDSISQPRFISSEKGTGTSNLDSIGN